MDLQLLWRAGASDGHGLKLPLLAQLCQRTFDYRNVHGWPPVPSMPILLDPAYQAARTETGTATELAETLPAAIEWLNARIAEIEDARRHG